MHDDVEELGHVRLQRKRRHALPAINCGSTARLAPAHNNLDLESSVQAPAMMVDRDAAPANLPQRTHLADSAAASR